MALTRITSGGIAPGVVIKFDNNNTPTAPAFSFNNPSDTGTGIYQPATNEIAIATAGVERLRVKADGRVLAYNQDGTPAVLGGTNPDFVNATNIMLYVNQSDLNATDSLSNDGGNVNRPFKSIERALLEAARRSYVAGNSNDKFEAFTIMVMPGDYTIDNRPGVLNTASLTFTNFEQELYKFNPKNGGVIVPRGTSIVGYDLRKTVIRPKFVPSPGSVAGADTGDTYVISHVMYDAANMMERNRGYIQEQAWLYAKSQYPSLTYLNETCKRDIGYFIDGIISDLRQGGNQNSFIVGEFYTDGTTWKFLNSPNERAATKVAFEYARDLLIKAANNWAGAFAHTPLAGTTVTKTTFTAGTDYTVGNGDCSTVQSAVSTLTTIVTGIIDNPDTYTETYRKTPGVFEQTSIFKVTGGCYFWQMTFKDAKTAPFNGVSYGGGSVPTFTQAADPNYSHHRVVAFTYADQRTTDGELDQYYRKIDHWDTVVDGGNSRQVKKEEYEIVGDRSKNTTIDTVNSCSPYIFNCSLRSVFGMCGMHTDGSKVAENSFKSMVVAQFTGISLQRDNSAFYQPKDLEGDANNSLYNDAAGLTNPPIYADPDAEYRPEWRHFHIKASNGGFIQVVSVFAVGYADQFLAESGGDMSITNSNSNFGQISLRAKGSQFSSFAPASQGKITAVIPPRGISSTQSSVEFYAIDYNTTWQKNGQSDNIYNANQVATFTSNQNKFRLYLDIGGLNSEADIPELIVDSVDQTNGTTITKRYLNFGSNGNYNLFRDYYSTSGTIDASEAKIQTTVETETGGVNTYIAKVSLAGETAGETSGANSQRQGYFWDPTVNKIYIKVNADDAATDTFLANYIFATTTESVFTTTETTNPDGSIQIVTGTSNRTVLQYFDGFPSTLGTAKYIDNRSSSPSDLLWRIEYTIPKTSATIPKAPEKRFIIKGTRPENGVDGMPYTDYRFMVWDVEEITAWEKNVRDGKYYLTVIRTDINKFADSTANTAETITRRPTGITPSASFTTSFIEAINNFDKETRVTSNVNYLYPSVNEEGPTYDVRKIWNPPQTDSRVLVEPIGAGKRVKDLSVPNAKFYRGGSTPFADIPAMTSVTAEAVHRLVQSLDLRYAQSTTASTARLAVAPVLSWDSRAGANEYTTSNVDIYGSGSYRYGDNGTRQTIPTTSSPNVFGIDGEASERRIPVVKAGTTFTAPTLSNADSINNAAPTTPLYRPSILRASSHTWEYVGLGSGNYSTGFPNLQTRVLKNYEQFIAQGYENSGGFVASSGTNSNGDFYIGNQVVQAGGTSTVTLNVPKVRKSSESNYVDITNIENRISNAVVNVTAAIGRNSSSQNALKALSNFFNTAKLSVTDRATIQSLIVNDRLFIANTRINNGSNFPEANTEAYGFVKAARPEKTGFISTDTNDRLYVSPKFLDAWRIKRQLVSASNITLDNNRIYLQPLSRTLLDSASAATSTAITTSTSTITVKESAGIPTYGILDIDMALKYVEVGDYKVDGANRVYLNPRINVNVNYSQIDYTSNIITLNANQNYVARQTYLENILGTTGYNTVIKHWSSPIDDGANASEKDIKYLRSNLTQNFSVSAAGNPTPESPVNLFISTTDWPSWPDRGAVTLREYPKGGVFRYSTYVYFKGATGQLILTRKVANASGSDTGHTYNVSYNNGYAGIPSKNVFFSGCSTTVSFSDRWAREEPFIPSVESISEDIDLESATLYTVPEKSVGYTGEIDTTFINNSLPNPFSSKALGVNLQNRQAVKKFAPLTTFGQVQSWCENSGFNINDNVELLMKPGYYKLDGAAFPCQITINGTGLQKSSVFAGKEQTGTSLGRMGGYLETSTKRGDSVYFYRSPNFYDQYGNNTDKLYTSVSGGLTSKGGFNLSNVHFLGLNDAVIKNEILDEAYSSDSKISEARKVVRKAYYIKNTSNFPNTVSTDGIAGALSFTANTTSGLGKATISYYLNSDDIMVAALGSANDGDLNSADKTTSRYMIITIEANKFYSTSDQRQYFVWARNYIIPGTTLYWLPSGGTVSSSTRSTKVVNVRYTNRSVATTWDSTSTEKIEVLVSTYQGTTNNTNKGNSSSYTNATEDLDLNSGAGAYTNGTDAKAVFVNEDGAEFATLTYNWALNNRRSFLPKGFTFAGGYQAAIIYTVQSTANAGSNQLTLDSIEGLKTGDIIFGTNIPQGATITVPNSGTTITLSDNILTGGCPSGSKVSFTQIDDFGNEILKYDRPEIFGIINGYEQGTINLVIDLNPSADIDSSIRQYPFTGFASYVAMLMQFKSSTGEDGGVTLPYFYNGFKRITGTTSSRFVLLQVSPGSVASISDPTNPASNIVPYIDNSGINAGILSRFATFGPFSLLSSGGKGTGFTAGNVVASNVSTTAGLKTLLDDAITNGGSGHNIAATVILTPQGGATGAGATFSVNINSNGAITSFNVGGTITTNYNGTFTLTVVDRKGYIMVNGRLVSTSATSFRNDEEFIAVCKENLLIENCPYIRSGTTQSNAFGKNIYLNWPYSHRALRRRFLAASLPNIGNFCAPVVNVDAIPGSNVPFNISDVTIGAQSPADTSANRFGGGYSGGIIRARGSNLSIRGVRIRGNLSLDWTGLLYSGGSRNQGSFTYGHSVEMIQMEDENKLSSLGSGQEYQIGTARDDEDFLRKTEFDPRNNCYIEPAKDPYGTLADADSRTFPISSYQAIRRFNQSEGSITVDGVTIPKGGLLSKVELSERYETPNPIYYNELSTGYAGNASGIRLRWNNTGASVSGASSVGGTLSARQLSFLYLESDNEVVSNIFLGAFASRIVKTTNIATSYATVTKVQLPTTAYDASGVPTSGGAYRLALISYSGSIPLSTAAGSNIKFLTNYLTTNRYKYITTTTARYAKLNYQGHSELNLVETGTPQYAVHSDIKIERNGTPSANLSRSSIVYLVNNRDSAGTTPGRAYISTDGSGNITTFDIVSYGSGHLESDTFKITSDSAGTNIVTGGITLTAVRNLTDDIEMFDPGEFIAVLPSNCFVLNSINNPSVANIKTELQKAKLIFKPGSYVQQGNTYYKVSKDNTSYSNKPYLGVYRYVNPINTADIRANIVVMLEDVEYQPTYGSNTRFDIFDNDNILDYWPSSGRCVIGNLETCDFVKSGDPTTNTGYTLILTRSMTKYYPHYIRDWEGLDPYDSLSEDVSVESFAPTTIRLADPVDATCFGFKRIKPDTTNIANVTTKGYISPTGKYSTSVAKVSIPSSSASLNADFEKLSIGQVVTIPYRDLDPSGWSDVTFTAGNALDVAGTNTSTNRAGDLRISGTIASASTTFNVDYRVPYQIVGSTNANSSIFNSVNPSAVGYLYLSPGGSNRLSAANFQIGPGGFRYATYYWNSITGSYTGGTSTQLAILGDTFQLATAGTYTASLTNGSNLITVTATSSGGLFLGQAITGTGISGTAYITGYAGNDPTLTGRGGTGTYRISSNATQTTSSTITGTNTGGSQDYVVYYPGQTGYWQRTVTLKTYDQSTGTTTITMNAPVSNSFTGGSILFYSYNVRDANVVLTVDKALLSNINSGTVFDITPAVNYSSSYYAAFGTASDRSYLFKSRILDMFKNTSDNTVDLFLADEVPFNWTNSGMRHFGFMFINHGGWTYPKTGGSSFRSSNVIPGSSTTTILIPNRSGRVQPGDNLTYEWENEDTGELVTHASVITAVAAVDSDGYSSCTLSTSSNHILHSAYTSKDHWMSIDDVFVSHRAGNFTLDGPVADKFIFSDTGLKLTFGDYSMWNEFFQDSRRISGRAGWVGNFGITRTSKLIDGLGLNGASAVQWGRQYNTSIWLAAVPFHAAWQSTALSTYMTQIQSADGIEGNFAPTTFVRHDGAGNFNFQTINHSWLAYGNVYSGLNTSLYTIGSGAYDTQPYRFTRNETKLVYSLQDASISTSDGSITGGNNPRIQEQLVIRNVIHYKPSTDFASSNLAGSGTLTATSGSTAITGTSSNFTQYILPGDNLYTSSASPVWIGTVRTVNSDTSITLVSNAATSFNSTGWFYVSTRVKRAGENTSTVSTSSIFSGGGLSSGVTPSSAYGTAGFNVIRSGVAGFDRYNFKFGISRRVYNQTPLLNTRGEIVPTNSVDNSALVVRPSLGDLSVYRPGIFNVNVTRFNPKTHVERSISVVGSQVNI
jgi:hypothetical protein